MRFPAFALTATFVFSCMPDSEDPSELRGASADEITAFEKEKGKELKPKFAELYSAAGEQKVVRLAIFISYDKESEPPPGTPELDTMPGPPVLALTEDRASDYGTIAFDTLRAWFANKDDPSRSFLKDPVVTGSGESYLLKGKGPAIAGLAPSMQWEITLRLGEAKALAADVGRAMATNHITMLNGHFYPEDAAAAAAKDGAAQQPAFAKLTSDIYGPAMDAFTAAAPQSPMGYRILVFNGCFSEAIEDLVLKTVAKVGQDGIDLVGQRGRSNYRHFGPQIASFLGQLVAGAKWSTTLGAFKFEDPPPPAAAAPPAGQPEVSRHEVPLEVIPVLRNKEIGERPLPAEAQRPAASGGPAYPGEGPQGSAPQRPATEEWPGSESPYP